MNEPIRFLVVVRRLFFLTLVVTLVAQCEHNKDGGRTVVGRCTIIPFTSALATSSRNLKKSTQQSRSVVSRLAKAARDAAAAKKRLLEQENNREDVNSTDEKKLPTITNLYAVIDEELLHPKNGNKPSRETSSIRVLLEHNTENEVFLTQGDTDEPTSTPEAQHASTKGRADIKDSRNKGNKLRPHQVAIVFARPQVDGQVTIEYASRLMSLAKLIKYDGYRPDLICFCGSYSFISSVHNGDQPKTEAAVSDTAAGVIFFRHLCAANDIPLVDIDLCMIPEEVQEEASTLIDGIHDDINDGVWNDTLPPESPPLLKMVPSSPSKLFHPVVEELLRSQYLEQWLDQSQVFESETDEYGMTRREPRKKIQIHWTLVSTEYHLCNLNDIHIRSPRQSPLTTLVHEVEQAVSRRFRRGIVKNTWSFRYSAYPYVYYDESDGDGVLIAFLGKCYLMAQGLVPLLVNLRGVAENSEFFQRDNYRTLVATRRSFATLLEEMNEAYLHKQERKTSIMVVPPTMKAKLQQIRSKPAPGGKRSKLSTDIHLECALLSLGRCRDLVRPAGTFSAQSVSKQEWRAAIQHLQDFMWRIEQTCDPDRPLPAKQWGKELLNDQRVIDILL